MATSRFGIDAPGSLHTTTGTAAEGTLWQTAAFAPDPLPEANPELSRSAWQAVANARASLGAFGARLSHLPDPTSFRLPTTHTEAHSTSALEGTYAPLEDVLTSPRTAPLPPTGTSAKCLTTWPPPNTPTHGSKKAAASPSDCFVTSTRPS